MRNQRIADLIHKELAELFIKSVYDPRLKHISLTGVKLSPDLKEARIFYIVNDTTELALVQKTLEKGTGFLRSQLAQAVHLKRVPRLTFTYDPTIERANRITDLINRAFDQSDDDDLS